MMGFKSCTISANDAIDSAITTLNLYTIRYSIALCRGRSLTETKPIVLQGRISHADTLDVTVLSRFWFKTAVVAVSGAQGTVRPRQKRARVSGTPFSLHSLSHPETHRRANESARSALCGRIRC